MPDPRLLDECVHCGFCLPSCPTYQSWGQEMDSPRGRIYLMKGELGPAAAKHIDRCLGCMACVTACPSGVKYGTLIAEARVELEKVHRRPRGERLVRGLIFALLPHPRRLRLLLPFQLLYQKLLRWLPLPRRLRPLAAIMPPVGARHLSARLPEVTPARGPRRARVALLAGCVQRVYFPDVNDATLKVLSAEGVEVVVPPGLGCCGALSMHAGREDEARRFADAAARSLRDVDAVVVNAAGCGSWMKEWQTRPPVKDVTELLVELGPVAERRPMKLRAAYHDACHHAHAQRIRAQPRALLGAIPGLELVDIPDGDQCCGSAGVYNLLQPESAREIGLRKVENVLAVKPEMLVSANPGCTLQIQMLLGERGVTLPARHPIELLAAALE